MAQVETEHLTAQSVTAARSRMLQAFHWCCILFSPPGGLGPCHSQELLSAFVAPDYLEGKDWMYYIDSVFPKGGYQGVSPALS